MFVRTGPTAGAILALARDAGSTLHVRASDPIHLLELR